MSYRIEFARAAVKQFTSLPRDVQVRLKNRIDSLREAPRPVGAVKMKGEEDLYRIRTGDYRIIYQIRDSVLIVLVVIIGHRREIYR